MKTALYVRLIHAGVLSLLSIFGLQVFNASILHASVLNQFADANTVYLPTIISSVGIASQNVEPVSGLGISTEVVEPNAQLINQVTEPAQSNALDRIDQTTLPLDGTYSYTKTGAGVRVYIFDSGIRETHQELEDRILPGYDVRDANDDTDDCIGTGTFAAGLVGGATYGVAKDVQMIPVRDGCHSGWFSARRTSVGALIAAVEWITEDHQSNPGTPSVVLINKVDSDIERLEPVREAIANSVAAGLTWVVSAGNQYGRDACDYFPANMEEVITVGSSVPTTDEVSSISNQGSCIDLFAPGEDVTSAWPHTNTSIKTRGQCHYSWDDEYNSDGEHNSDGNDDTDNSSNDSEHEGYDSWDHDEGYSWNHSWECRATSSAAPLTAGVAAQYLGANPTATPTEVKAALLNSASRDQLTNVDDNSPNLLLFSEPTN